MTILSQYISYSCPWIVICIVSPVSGPQAVVCFNVSIVYLTYSNCCKHLVFSFYLHTPLSNAPQWSIKWCVRSSNSPWWWRWRWTSVSIKHWWCLILQSPLTDSCKSFHSQTLVCGTVYQTGIILWSFTSCTDQSMDILYNNNTGDLWPYPMVVADLPCYGADQYSWVGEAALWSPGQDAGQYRSRRRVSWETAASCFISRANRLPWGQNPDRTGLI